MSIFNILKGQSAKCAKDEIIAPAKGEIIDITKVSDPLFAGKVLGESIAFKFEGDEVEICAPCSGTLTALFPTGHAFGITMDNKVEVMIHIGINTVETKGNGFALLDKKQGDKVKAGEPIVKADLKALSQSYDTSTMLIITNAAGHQITFNEPGPVEYASIVGRTE